MGNCIGAKNNLARRQDRNSERDLVTGISFIPLEDSFFSCGPSSLLHSDGSDCDVTMGEYSSNGDTGVDFAMSEGSDDETTAHSHFNGVRQGGAGTRMRQDEKEASGARRRKMAVTAGPALLQLQVEAIRRESKETKERKRKLTPSGMALLSNGPASCALSDDIRLLMVEKKTIRKCLAWIDSFPKLHSPVNRLSLWNNIHDVMAPCLNHGQVIVTSHVNKDNTCAHLLTQCLALNALDLTAPASDALLKNRKNAWVQLAGHPGAFAPAGPHTIWKKRLAKENTETVVYQQLRGEGLAGLAPRFYREVEYNGDFFIEMEDLLQHFHDPHVMDVKMGSRTFLESEVRNPALRRDLYEKMVKLDPCEPTPEEHEQQAITKLRYMQFREHGSSSSTLGFRVEAIKASGEPPVTDIVKNKKLKQRAEVQALFASFIGYNHIVRNKFVRRLKEIRHKFESSRFFETHEIIGSSLLFLFDETDKAGVWMIDFAKTHLHADHHLTHRAAWALGSFEDGYLSGLDHMIQILEDIECVDSTVHVDSVSLNCGAPDASSVAKIASSSSPSSAASSPQTRTHCDTNR